MAGGKKTPRQKMIEMMYLILTALLALNVSKQIVAAFVTINDKLNSSAEVISATSLDAYGTFDSKRAAIIAEKGDTKVIDLWQGKAEVLKKRTKQMVHYLLSEADEMITIIEGLEPGEDWVAERDDDGLIVRLKSLLDIQAMDNYDQPTRMFVGGNPMNPIDRGMAILDSINNYRNEIVELVGNYSVGDKKYSITAPEYITDMKSALATANPEDTTFLMQLYRSLTYPDTLRIKDGGETKVVPWPSAIFDHAPIVAAAAMFTSIKLDLLNGESHAVEYMLSKVDSPVFNFNKIEPLAFARTGYINAGDSLNVRVMIAAYDSTEMPPIKYGINDSVSDNWVNTSGAIRVDGNSPGDYRLTGIIGVKEKGELDWKPWSFNYTVGKPSGTVSLPQMNVLYRGYSNIVEGAASGFPNYTLTGGGNVTMTKSGERYIATPGQGREAVINIAGVAADGSTSNLGSYKFRVHDLPKPSIRLGRINDGETALSSEIRTYDRLFAGYPPEIPLEAEFSVVDWEVAVSGAARPYEGRGAVLSGDAMRSIANARPGALITIVSSYKEPGGAIKRQNAVIKVK